MLGRDQSQLVIIRFAILVITVDVFIRTVDIVIILQLCVPPRFIVGLLIDDCFEHELVTFTEDAQAVLGIGEHDLINMILTSADSSYEHRAM
jgi:hypothetical protein